MEGRRSNLRSWTPSVGNKWLQTRKEGDTRQTRFPTAEHVESDQDTQRIRSDFLLTDISVFPKQIQGDNDTKING